MPQTCGRSGLFIRGTVRDIRAVLVKFVVNGSFELGRSGVNGFGQCKGFVVDGNRLQGAHMRLHPAAHVASAHGMTDQATEVNFHESDPIDIAVQ